MTDQEFIDWVGGLLASVEAEFACGPHDMDHDKAIFELLKKRLAHQSKDSP